MNRKHVASGAFIALLLVAAVGIGVTTTSGQILSEKTYYNTTYDNKNLSEPLPEQSTSNEYIGHLEAQPDSWQLVEPHQADYYPDNSAQDGYYNWHHNFEEKSDYNNWGYRLDSVEMGSFTYQDESGYMAWQTHGNAPVAQKRVVDTSSLDLSPNETVYVAIDRSYKQETGDQFLLTAAGDTYYGSTDNGGFNQSHLANMHQQSSLGYGNGPLAMAQFVDDTGDYWGHVSNFQDPSQWKSVTSNPANRQRIISPWTDSYGINASEKFQYARTGVGHRLASQGEWYLFKIEDPKDVAPVGENKVTLWAEHGTTRGDGYRNTFTAIRGAHIFTEDFASTAGAQTGNVPWAGQDATGLTTGQVYSSMSAVGQAVEDKIDEQNLAKSGNSGGFERTPTPYKEAGVTNPDNLDTSKDAVWGYSETENGKALEMKRGALIQEFDLPGLMDTQSNYISLNIESTYSAYDNVNWELRQFGSTVASGSTSAGSSKISTAEFDSKTNDMTLVVWSESPYLLKSAKISALQQTSAGDPLAFQSSPVTLDDERGYDEIMGMFINVLSLTTDTLLYIVMASMLVGMVLFSYSKSVRDQELGESLIYGAVMAGVILLALTPTFNTITWIFTGDVQRAPLADPQLEAEPPTYYSTEFQDGTKNGWEHNNPARYNAPGSIRPVSVGDGFNLRLQSGTSGEIATKHSEHISLADQLGTGFVGLTASTKGKSGFPSNPHQTLMQVRVYLTEDDSDPYWIDGSNYYSSGSNSYNYESMKDQYGIHDSNGNYQGDTDDRHDLVAAETLAKSFDGQKAQVQDIIQYNLSRPYIHTEVVVYNNRGDSTGQGTIKKIRVGATTSAGHT